MTELLHAVVRVPASTANLGPGFDALGMALDLHAEIGRLDGGAPPPAGAHVADDGHPATVAHRAAGGTARLWVRSPIPMGRGLGYSGAMRVGGAVAALGLDRLDEVLALTTRLEGHADNVAASIIGGVVATSGGLAVRVPLSFDPAVVVWVPDDSTTSTDRSRSALPDTVSRADAAFNIGRTALLVAALAAGDTAALAAATEDRMHQDVRLADRPESARALAAGRAGGAWCGWLSGSGPSVAFLCSTAATVDVVAALPASGHAKVLRIDHGGVVLLAPDGSVRRDGAV